MIYKFGKVKRFIAVLLVGILSLSFAPKTANAVTMQEIQKEKKEAEKQKKDTENKLNDVQEEIDSITDEQAALEEEIAALDELLFDMILEVNMIKSDIDDKNLAIEEAQQEYDAAVEQVESQKEAMNKRIKYMYEKGNRSYMELLLESKSMAEAVNKVEYTEKLYVYDREMLEKYQLLKQEVADKEAILQSELNDLEEIKEDLEIQESQLNALIAEKQATVENFQEQLANAKSKAESYEKQLKEQSDKLKQISAAEQAKAAEEARKKAAEEARRKAEEAAKKKMEEEEANKKLADELKNAVRGDSQNTVQTDNNTVPEIENNIQNTESAPPSSGSTVTASGSGIGTDIANYGLQFVGNPYVSGGTSLTNGCDCSGFTQSVYSHFGISIPRSSYSQSSGGQAIDFANIQAGDIIYYGGHVAIYIGNNKIVHASTAATGIKVSSAFYRSIITIRRYY